MTTKAFLAPAKINLFLRVLGKRPDGYHELVSLMCRVDLYDRVVLSFDRPSTRVTCSHPQVPEGEANLAHRAAQRFLNALGESRGVVVSIEKNIPVAAGLGGGSSNAAAVLMGLNDHYGSPFSLERLMDLGLQLGADVPFFLFEHTAIATGIGERLEPVEGMPPLSFLLVRPPCQVSTAWVYEHVKLGLTKGPENYNVSWFLEDLSKLKGLLCNDLEQVTAKAFPEIYSIKKALLDCGAEGALMSGSGPTVFGLFQEPQQASLALTRIRQQERWDAFLVNLLLP